MGLSENLGSEASTRIFFGINGQGWLHKRCHTPGGIRPRRGPAAAATKIDIESGTETEIEEENLDIAALQPILPAVNVRGEREDTDRTPAMPDPGATTTVLQTAGHTTDTTARATGAWTTAGNGTGIKTGITGRRATTTLATPRPATTFAGDATGTARTHTGGKAAGVSTNEGGVEPGPIAHPPR